VGHRGDDVVDPILKELVVLVVSVVVAAVLGVRWAQLTRVDVQIYVELPFQSGIFTLKTTA
jgi:hypothetical protein